MKSALTILTAIAATASVVALPTPESPTDNDLQPRGGGHFTMCTGTLWHGECQERWWRNAGCYPVPEELNGWIQSASPHVDENGWCKLYREEQCLDEKEGDASGFIIYPGKDNFETAGMVGSWKSWRCTCFLTCKLDSEAAPDANATG